MNAIERAVRQAKHPVALTGAGISAPSGIPTFQGTWKGRPIREFLTRSYFSRDPVGFFELYLDMVSWCKKPVNAAHEALAKWGIPIITQNIDGLHTRAGSKNILEIHGTLSKVVCRSCGREEDAFKFAERVAPVFASGSGEDKRRAIKCECGATWDTDIVLYDDKVRHLDEAYEWAETCDLMLVIGTSLVTYPAAFLPDVARQRDAKIIMVNDDCVTALTRDDD